MGKTQKKKTQCNTSLFLRHVSYCIMAIKVAVLFLFEKQVHICVFSERKGIV